MAHAGDPTSKENDRVEIAASDEIGELSSPRSRRSVPQWAFVWGSAVVVLAVLVIGAFALAR